MGLSLMDKAVEIKNLTVKYPLSEKFALSDISFSIFKKEMVGIIGPTGAGKTTLCLCMKGLIPHMIPVRMDGFVKIFGIDTRESSVPELSRKVGLVLDDPEAQLTQLTVEEEVALGLENLGLEPSEIRERVREALSLVGLEGFEDRAPIDLSGGQQQRLAIASVIAMYPEILILDEPTSNLDPVGKEEVFETLYKLKKEKEITIIVVEHEIERLAEFTDKIAVLYDGRLVMMDTPKKIFNLVEELNSINERVPQVTELSYNLRKRNPKLFAEELPITLSEAFNEYSEIVEGGL